jgi:hypothetical protein
MPRISNKFFSKSKDEGGYDHILKINYCEVGHYVFYTQSDYQLKLDKREAQMENKTLLKFIYNSRDSGKKFMIIEIYHNKKFTGVPDKFNGNILVLERME